MRLKDFAKASDGTVGEIVLLPPSVIQIEPGFNPREPRPELEAHIREIADSIIADGYDRTEFIKVKFDGENIWVRDGHCRLAAVRIAIAAGVEIDTLPCVPLMKGSDEVDQSYQVLSTQAKLPLAPLEYATQIKKLLKQGQTEKQIATRLGKPRDFVERMLELAGATPEIREAVQAKRISPTEAVNVVRRNGAEAGAVLEAADQMARAEGRTRIRPRDVAAVTAKPRIAKPSVVSRSEKVVRIYKNIANKEAIPLALRIALDDLVEETEYLQRLDEPTTEENTYVHGPDTGASARTDA